MMMGMANASNQAHRNGEREMRGAPPDDLKKKYGDLKKKAMM